MKEPLKSERISELPFSSAIQTDCSIYVSGQGGLNPVTGEIFGLDINARTTIYCDLNYDLLVEIDAIAIRRKL